MSTKKKNHIDFGSNSVVISTGGLEQVFLPTDEKQHWRTARSDDVHFQFFDNKAPRVDLTRTVNDFIVDQFSRIPEVNYLYSEQDGNVFYVHVVLRDSDEDAVNRVLEIQERVIDEFQDFEFDFSVLFQMGKDVNELISPATPLYQRAS